MGRPGTKPPTILDIAAEAGVSKSAVSRALLGQGEVSPETRERIELAAARLGYVANALARSLVSSRTRMIGAVLRDVSRPYYALMQREMQLQAERRGYQVVTVTSASELEVADALRALTALVSLQVDGLVIASAKLPSEQIVPHVKRVPLVVAGRRETSREITSVFCDDEDGGIVMADHMLQLGHRRVAVIVVDQEYSLSQYTRAVAMIDRITAAGGVAVRWNVPSDDGRAVTAVAARFDLEDVTAIMCPTDGAALDVLEVLRDHAGSSANAVAVSGYDGFGPLSAPYIGLTTFRVPIEEIGRTAIDLVLDRIEGTAKQDRLVALRGALVIGRSAGPVLQA